MDAVAVINDSKQAAHLVHAERRRLLEALVEPDSATGLARRFALPRQRLNYHLRELEAAGLLRPVEYRKKGNCTEKLLQATARSYLISAEALGDLGTAPDAPADRFSATFLLSLASRIVRELAGLMSRATTERKRLATLAIDTEVTFASPDDRARFADELTDTIAHLVSWYNQPDAPNGRRFRLIAASYPAPHPQQSTQGAAS